MLHPFAELRRTGAIEGYGLFAVERIAAGTITYVKDELEVVIRPDSPLLTMPHYASVISRYSYVDNRGKMVLSWDLAKYMNHSCGANSLSTGWGFEIAIRDIEPGEEITDDYGLFFNQAERMVCCCGEAECRGMVVDSAFEGNVARWDGLLRGPLAAVFDSEQALLPFLDERTVRELQRFAESGRGYRSVGGLRSTVRRAESRMPLAMSV